MLRLFLSADSTASSSSTTSTSSSSSCSVGGSDSGVSESEQRQQQRQQQRPSQSSSSTSKAPSHPHLSHLMLAGPDDFRGPTPSSMADSGRRTQSLEILNDDFAELRVGGGEAREEEEKGQNVTVRDHELTMIDCGFASLHTSCSIFQVPVARSASSVRFADEEGEAAVAAAAPDNVDTAGYSLLPRQARLTKSRSIPVHLTVGREESEALPASLRPDPFCRDISGEFLAGGMHDRDCKLSLSVGVGGGGGGGGAGAGVGARGLCPRSSSAFLSQDRLSSPSSSLLSSSFSSSTLDPSRKKMAWTRSASSALAPTPLSPPPSPLAHGTRRNASASPSKHSNG